jgi:hypothetical protein
LILTALPALMPLVLGNIMHFPDQAVSPSTLALLMLGVFADDHDPAFSLDNLALIAHRLHRRSYFHSIFLLRFKEGVIFTGNACKLLCSPGDPALCKVIG